MIFGSASLFKRVTFASPLPLIQYRSDANMVYNKVTICDTNEKNPLRILDSVPYSIAIPLDAEVESLGGKPLILLNTHSNMLYIR